MNLRAWGMLIVLAAVWGATFLFMRIASPAVGPVWLIFFRVALAALIMTAGIRLTQTPVPWRQTWKGMLWLGFINAALPFVFIAAAELTLSSGLASLINATTPMFTLLVAALTGQERLTLRQLGGMFLSFLGVTVLLNVSPSLHGTSTVLASLGCLGAALCYAVGTVSARQLTRGVPPLASAWMQQIAASLVLVPVLPFAPLSVSRDPAVWLSVVGLAILSTALAYWLYFNLLEQVGASRTILVTYLVPGFAVLFGVLFLGESLTGKQWVAMALILAGVIWSTRGSPAPVRTEPNRAETKSV